MPPLDHATPPFIRERCVLDELREYRTEMAAVLRDAETFMEDDRELPVEKAIEMAREKNEIESEDDV